MLVGDLVYNDDLISIQIMLFSIVLITRRKRGTIKIPYLIQEKTGGISHRPRSSI